MTKMVGLHKADKNFSKFPNSILTHIWAYSLFKEGLKCTKSFYSYTLS